MSIQLDSLRDGDARKNKKRSSRKDRDPTNEKKRKRHNTEEDERDGAGSKKPRLKDGGPSSTSRSEPPVNDDVQNSPFHNQTSSLYLPLSPISQLNPLEGLCAEHLSPLLLSYYPPFRGVILSYDNVRLSEHPTASPTQEPQVLAKPLDEYGSSFVWVTADFLLLRPRSGQWIEGWINLQNESHLGLVCWNLFNASIERDRLPEDWTWTGVGGRMTGAKDQQSRNSEGGGGAYEDRGQGYFVDGDGKRVEGLVRFRVTDCEAAFAHDRGFLNLQGTLLDEEAEKDLVERERRLARMKDRMLESNTGED
ncbi:MAG: hypothetical protein M1816_003551 [Peltula sp. TS41687]|nr:MAG: hypothetical protein M1816_003551 [Peltula sp. TS41687]